MTKYLYGASVQGIQSFIFQTNKLKEIVGASEIVEKVCAEWFFKAAKKEESYNKDTDNDLILAAAGNIKYFFQTKEECELVVKTFPKFVMENAPGITISQAVVKVDGDSYTYDDIKCLEAKLKTQRSKPTIPIEQGYMILERARRTGGVVIKEGIKDKTDYATIQKEKFQSNASLFEKLSGIKLDEESAKKKLPINMADMTKSGNNSWIAVIHADGNGLGKILQKYGEKLINNNEFKAFSNAIQDATEAACKTAFEKVVKIDFDGYEKYPIRPIIIGGDDVTILIRGDLALDFTNEFLNAFEEESNAKFKQLKTSELHDGLTACAGICYVKDNYPLHYALNLSEELCKDAKKMVKENTGTWKNIAYLPQSSLAMFKVMDSFVDDLESMKKRTMKADEGIDYYAGPYWLKKQTNKELVDVPSMLEYLKKLDDVVSSKKEENNDSKAVSKIRQLISESFSNFENMSIMKERMKEVNNDLYKSMHIETSLNKNSKSMLYDVINLHGFKY